MKSLTNLAGALLLLAAQARAIAYTDEPDPYYGQSPPVYPTRMFTTRETLSDS